jgi:hypothetical protein
MALSQTKVSVPVSVPNLYVYALASTFELKSAVFLLHLQSIEVPTRARELTLLKGKAGAK